MIKYLNNKIAISFKVRHYVKLIVCLEIASLMSQVVELFYNH